MSGSEAPEKYYEHYRKTEEIATLVRKKPGTLKIEPQVIEKFAGLYEGRKHRSFEKTIRKLFKKALPVYPRNLNKFTNTPSTTMHLLASYQWRFIVEETRGLIDIFSVHQTNEKTGNRDSRSQEEETPKEKDRNTPELPLDKIRFTNHAVDQFIKRFTGLAKEQLADPKRKLLDLLAGATEENAIDGVHRVKRIISHKFILARYFVNGRWRFVIKEEEDGTLLVLTFEERLY